MRNLLNAMWVSALYGGALVKYISPSSSFTLSASSSAAPPPPTSRASNWRCHKGVRGQCLFKVKLTLMFSSGNGRERGSSCSLLSPSDSQAGRCLLTQAELANFLLGWARRRGAAHLIFALLSLSCAQRPCASLLKPEGTLWVNQSGRSANTSSGRCPAKGAKASGERELCDGKKLDSNLTQSESESFKGLKIESFGLKEAFCV